MEKIKLCLGPRELEKVLYQQFQAEQALWIV
jgi:hypothetical protein